MIEHLIALRRRLILVVSCFLVLFGLFFCLSNDVFRIVASPLTHLLPSQESLIATQITTPVLTPLTLAANLALLCTTPYALFHLWQFVAPGLYRNERKGLKSTILLSVLLFFIGVLFCFYVVLPLILQFFIHAVPTGVHLMPDMAAAIDFMTRMMLLFGLCFQVPLICVLLVKIGLMDLAALQAVRPYWIVTAFILGMLLTPPDVLSQVTLAVPLCVLYELGIVCCRLSRTGHRNPTAIS